MLYMYQVYQFQIEAYGIIIQMSRLPFRILTVSSQESKHPASELLGGESQKGWQTARDCKYPQELTVQFPWAIKTKSLTTASHQFKISSKVQVFIKQNQQGTFRRLGYFVLSDNKKSNYKARQVKSVFFEFPCVIVKLVFGRNHHNQLNVFNQIGLISLEVNGEAVVQPVAPPPQTVQKQQVDQGLIDLNNQGSVSILRKKMLAAASRQDYEQANHFKALGERFKIQREKLLILQVKAQHALSQKDFKSYDRIKSQCIALKSAFARELSGKDQQVAIYVNNSVLRQSEASAVKQQIQQIVILPDRPIKMPDFKQNTPSKQAKSFFRPEHNRKPQQKLQIKGQQKQPSKQVVTKVKLDHDQVIIPALLKKSKKEEDQIGQQQQKQYQMLSKNLALVQQHFQVIEKKLWQQIFSQSWKEREGACRKVMKLLDDGGINPVKTSCFNALVNVVYLTIDDKNLNVVQASIDLLQKFAIEKQIVSSSRTDNSQIEAIVQSLVNRLSDSSTKIERSAKRVLIQLTNNPCFGPQTCISAITSRKTKGKSKSSSKLQLAKIKTLVQLLQQGNYLHHFSQILINFAKHFVESPSVQLREAVSQLLVLVAGEIGVSQVASRFQKIRPVFKEVLLSKLTTVSRVIKNNQSRPHLTDAKSHYLSQYRPFQNQSRHQSKSPHNNQFERRLQSRSKSPFKNQSRHQPRNQFKQGQRIRETKVTEESVVWPQTKQMRQRQLQSRFFEQMEKEVDQPSKDDQDVFDSSMQRSIEQARKQFKQLIQHKNPSNNYQSDQEIDSAECQYCGMYDLRFRDQQQFDRHLEQECQLVIQCESCGVVVEVWNLTRHLLSECDHRGEYTQCPNCKQAVLAIALSAHRFVGCLAAKRKEDAERCQLCHRDVLPPSKQSWRRHILNQLCSGYSKR